jgi:hypothetical protein
VTAAAHPPWRHLLLALAVVLVWGTNFVVIKVALAHLPPLLFAALRFALAFFPAVLFLPRPAVSWRNLAAYGVLLGVGEFGVDGVELLQRHFERAGAVAHHGVERDRGLEHRERAALHVGRSLDPVH